MYIISLAAVYSTTAAMDKQLIDKLIIININTILIIIKITSFNVIMNNVFILTITGIGPTNKVDRQFARIIFLVAVATLEMAPIG